MNHFREERIKHGFKTQKDLADKLFVNQTAVSQWERGVTTPSSQLLLRLSELYGVSTDYLLGRDEKKPTVQDDGLTEGERVLMKQFRQLTPEQQDMVLRMVQAAADNQQ